MKPAFISRDGVINHRVEGGVSHRTKLQFHDGSIDAIVRLCEAGYTVVMVTHQPGLSRGLFDLDELEAIHAIINDAVEEKGGQISAIFYCPHDKADHCYCRPPETGLLDVAAIELDCDFRRVPYFCDNDDEVTVATTKDCQPFVCDQSRLLAQAVTEFLAS